MSDISQKLKEQIETAISDKTTLNIIGGNSKSFYGRTPQGEPIYVGEQTGITNYEFTELVMTVRAGTTLEEIECALDKNGQMLAFEPPRYGASATIGGTIACNLSGPRRAYAGAARDYVLGSKIINGKAEVLSFGGEVMKNVAGYDVSRLMTGAMGTLGLLLEVSFKVLPKPISEKTLTLEVNSSDAILKMNQWATKTFPLSATVYVDGKLYVRLSGAESSVQSAFQQMGGEVFSEADLFWQNLKEQQLSFFKTTETLWRLSVPPTTSQLELSGECLMEWSGGLRWLKTNDSPEHIRKIVSTVGGQATFFKGHVNNQSVFQSMSPSLEKLHRNLKSAFDPHQIFNPGRLYESL